MPRFCADLSRLFTGLPFMDRFRAAKEAGFDAVEVPFPYDCPAQDMRDQLVWNDLTLVVMNCPPPNATGGAPGFAAIPGLGDRFRRDFDRTLRYARVLKPGHIHIMAGVGEGEAARAVFIENLGWAADRAPGQSLVIGPANTDEEPGCYLNGFDLAARILDTVNAPNLHLQFDAGHAHRITGDVASCWQAHGHRAAHVRIAGPPRPDDPAGGEIDRRTLFSRLDTDRYRGWVSADHIPWEAG